MGHPGTSLQDENNRVGTECTPSAASLGIEVLRSCWLGPEAEEKVLRLGLLAMREALGTEGLLEFPRRPNGAPRLMRQGFFERLLRGQTTLKECAAADISAAGADLGHLALKQLLAIRCMNFELAITNSNQHQASFIGLVDRSTMTSIAQRLLGDEVLPDAHCSVVIRHAVLIYGANRQLATQENAVGSDWWLLAVGGTRRYLNLPTCTMSSSVPQGHVYCYRSHSAADPRDPRRSRVFRWQALLVATPASWTEDPLSFEQRSRKKQQLRDVVVKSAASSDQQGTVATDASPSKAYGLFDTDFGNLCEQAEQELDALFGDAAPARGADSGNCPEAQQDAEETPCKQEAAQMGNLYMQAELVLDALFDSVSITHDERASQQLDMEDGIGCASDHGHFEKVVGQKSKAEPGDSSSADQHKGRPNVDEMFDSFMSELDQLGSGQLGSKSGSAAGDVGTSSEWSSSAAAAIDDFCGSLLEPSKDRDTQAQGVEAGSTNHSTGNEAHDGTPEHVHQRRASNSIAHQAPATADKVLIWDSRWLVVLVLLLACAVAALMQHAP